MPDLGSIKVKSDTTEVKHSTTDLNNFNKKAKETDKATEKISKGFSTMADSAKNLKNAIAAIGLLGFTSKIVNVAKTTEMYIARLKTMVGSMDLATSSFNRLNEFAKTTPFSLQQSIDGFVKLKALGLDPSERAMRSYGNTAAAMGTSMHQMIEAVADASTFEFERLLAFGIKSRQQGDNVTFTFRGVETTVKKSSKNIQEFLLGIGETDFSTAMDDQMNTIIGQTSNMDQAFNDLWITIGNILHVEAIVKKSLSAISSFINGVTGTLKIAQIEIIAYSEVFAALATDKLDFSDTIGKTFIEILREMQNEYGIQSEALRLVDTALGDFNVTTGEAIDKQKELNKELKDNNNIISIGGNAYDDLHNELIGFTTELEDTRWALDTINQMYEDGIISVSEYTKGLEKYGEKLKRLEGITDETTREMESDWDRLNTNIQSQFIDTFTDMLFGAKVKFSDFAKSIGKMWVNTFANQMFSPQSILGGSGTGGSASSSGFGFGDVLSIGGDLLSGAGMFGAFGTGTIGGMITPTLNSMFAGSGLGSFATGLMGPTASGASLGAGTGFLGGLGSAMPYIGMAIMAANMLGLFDDQNQPTNVRLGFGTNRDFLSELEPFGSSRTDFGFGTKTPFGRIFGEVGDFGHEGQATTEEARQAAKQLQQQLDIYGALDQALVEALDLSDQQVEEIAKNLNLDIENSMRHGVNIDELIGLRYTQLFDIIGGEANEIFDKLEGSISENLSVTIAYVSANEEVKSLYDDLIVTQDGNSKSIMELSSTLLTVNSVLGRANISLFELNTVGAKASTRLVELAGGIDKLAQKSNFYYDNFFDEEEKATLTRDRSLRAVSEFNERYGEFGTLTLDNTDSLRDFIEGLDSSDAAYNEVLNAALNMAPVMIEGSNAIDKITESQRAANDEAEETLRLQKQQQQQFRDQALINVGATDPTFAMRELERIWSPRITEANAWLAARGQGDLQFGQFAQQGVSGYRQNVANIQRRIYDYADSPEAQVAQQWIDEFSSALNQYEIYQNALNGNTDAVNDSSNGLDNFSNELGNARLAIADYVNALTLSDLSPLTNEQRLIEARGQYGRQLLLAQSGNVDALSGLPQTADAYLREARSFHASSTLYTDIFRSVQIALGSLAGIEQLQTGSDFIPQNGLFFLHQGESVTTAADNQQLHEKVDILTQEVANQTNVIGGLLSNANSQRENIVESNQRIADSTEEQADTRRVA
jgi:hypothetical protein